MARQVAIGISALANQMPELDNMASIANTTNMAKKASKSNWESVTNQIRRHVRDCGISCYAIAKAANIDESALSRFLSGERGISAKALDRLGELLEFEVVRHGPKS